MTAMAGAALGFPGEGLIRQWATIAGADVSSAIQRAETMYAGDPAAIQAGGQQAQAVADGLDETNSNLQGVGRSAATAWDSPQGAAFITAHNANIDQVNAARASAAGLAQSLNQHAQNVAEAKNAVAAASGLTATALGTLQLNDPNAIPVAQQDLQAWAGAINRIGQESAPATNAAARGAGAGAATGAAGAAAGSGARSAFRGGGGGGGGGGGVESLGGGAGSGTAVAGVADDPQVTAWINQALAAAGIPATQANVDALRLIIQKESTNNPNAINLGDSNARDGHPSQGLMQTIPSTFAAYRVDSLPNNITDPVANIAAGARYAIATYGSLQDVPGVKLVGAGHDYKGY